MPHKNVNVRKHGFNFAMCTICESLKDMISKVSKHDGRKVKNYELQLKRHNIRQESCRQLYHMWRTELI